MQLPHNPATRSIRIQARLLLVIAPLVLGLAGCNLFHLSLIRSHADANALAGPMAPILPNKYQLRKGQFVFVSDFEVQPEQALFRELIDLREQIIRELKLPQPSVLINVYLFEDRDRYERFMKAHYPDLPLRRAFFVAQPRGMGGGDDLLVYTFVGSHLRQDLRHELTHAILHSVLKDVPLWLDEGLAEFFELPPEARGVNRQHLILLQKEGFHPDLTRLEQLSQVQQMNPAEYREAWAWTHLLLRGKPEAKKALLEYVKQLRTTATPGSLQPRLKQAYPNLNEALLQHLGKV